jgi:tape measure domain-containing protein
MTDIASLRVAIETGDVRRANAELDKLERAAGRNTSAASSLGGAYGKLGGILAGVSFVATGREAIKLADTYASMTARMGLVTRGTDELTRAQRDLLTVAQQTRIGLVQTADLYGSLARNATQLGASQNEVIAVTRTINQALTISGTSATSAAAALVQLNQAFASGVLRGEELNSVLEQAPALARAIADGLGVPIGQLRKLGEEGKLTADKVFAALQKSSGSIQSAFEKMPLTVGQATTQAGNSVLVLVGQIDRLVGSTSAIAGFVSAASSRIDSLGEAFRLAGIEGRSFWSVVVGRFQGFAGGPEERIAAVTARITELQEKASGGFWQKLGIDNTPDTAQLRAYNAELELLNKVLKALRGEANPSDGSYESLEARRLKGLPNPPDKPKGGKSDPYGDELKSLRERLVLVGQNTEADKLAEQISIGKFGQIDAGQQSALLALAAEIDRRESNVRLQQEEGSAREAASRLAQASLASSLAETQRLIEGNQALRDEIELLGATADAKTAIEVARTRKTHTLLKKRADILANVEGNEAELQSLRQQMELLRQREGLLTQRQDRQNFLEPVKDLPKDAANETYTSVRDALAAAFRDTKNPIKAFAEGLGNAIFSRVTARLADAMAMQLVGSTGGGGLFGTLLSAAGSLFGGGVPVGNGTGATGDFARFDRGLATGTNYVPYDGMKATLHEGEAVIPKRYNPAAGGSPMGGTRVVLTYAPNVRIDARTDQAQVQQLVAQANAEGQQQMLQRLADMGVL